MIETAAISMDVGSQIKQIREALGMTQVQLAKRAGMSQSAVAEIESGKRSNPSLSTLQSISRGLEGRFYIGMQPENIPALLDRKSEELARKIVMAASGSAAIELQLPDQTFVEEQVQKTKAEILKSHRSRLWDSP